MTYPEIARRLGISPKTEENQISRGLKALRETRSTDPAVPGTDLTQPIAATTYVDAQVAPGQTYYYSVVSVAPTGFTAFAPVVAFAVPAQLVKTGRPATRFVPPPAPSTLPAITSINPTQPYPGQIVTLTGANLTGITGIAVSRAGQPAADAVANLQLLTYPAAGQGPSRCRPTPPGSTASSSTS